MTDRLVERLREALCRMCAAYREIDERFNIDGFQAEHYEFAQAALDPLTLPQTDLEQRARDLSPHDVMDEAGLERWRQIARETNGHDLVPLNANSLRRLIGSIDQARALASSSVPEQDSWQPIKTAPRDGTWFLAVATSPGWGATRIVRFKDPSDRLPIHGEGNMWPSAPTHWMPLPPPPAVSGLQDRGASQEDGR